MDRRQQKTRAAIFAAFGKLLAEKSTARLRYRKSSIPLTLAGQHFMRILKQKTICSNIMRRTFQSHYQQRVGLHPHARIIF